MALIRLIHCEDAEGIVGEVARDLPKYTVQCLPLRELANHPSQPSSPPSSSSTPSSAPAEKSSVFDVFFITPMFESILRSYSATTLRQLFSKSSDAIFIFYQSCHSDTVAERQLISRVTGMTEYASATVTDENLETAAAIINKKVKAASGVTRNPSKSGLRKFMLQPQLIYPGQTEVLVIFLTDRYVKDGDTVTVRRAVDSTMYQCAKRGTKDVWSFSVKQVLREGDNDLDILINDQSVGTGGVRVMDKMDALAAILNDVTSPLQFLSQALRLYPAGSREELDLDLSDRVCKQGHNLRWLFEEMPLPELKSEKEFPTILHFGAKLGLTSFCKGLGAFPGFKAAMRVQNNSGWSPVTIAEQNGHYGLARELEEIYQREDLTLLPSPTTPRPRVKPRTGSDTQLSALGSDGSSSSSSFGGGLRPAHLLPHGPSADSGTGSGGSVGSPNKVSVMQATLSPPWRSARVNRQYDEIPEAGSPFTRKQHVYDEPWSSWDLGNTQEEVSPSRERSPSSSSTRL